MVKDGERLHGMTANAFSSVSLDPPLVLVCIDKGARTHDLVKKAGTFTISILSEEQQFFSDRFAGRHKEVSDPLEGIPIVELDSGNSVIAGNLGWLECDVEHAYPGGDHTIFVGRVRQGEVGDAARPLLFFSSRYTRLPEEVSVREGR